MATGFNQMLEFSFHQSLTVQDSSSSCSYSRYSLLRGMIRWTGGVCPCTCFSVITHWGSGTLVCLTLSRKYVFADWFLPVSSVEAEFADWFLLAWPLNWTGLDNRSRQDEQWDRRRTSLKGSLSDKVLTVPRNRGNPSQHKRSCILPIMMSEEPHQEPHQEPLRLEVSYQQRVMTWMKICHHLQTQEQRCDN